VVDLEVVLPGQQTAMLDAMKNDYEVDSPFGFILSTTSPTQNTVDVVGLVLNNNLLNPTLTASAFGAYRASFSAGYAAAVQVLITANAAVTAKINAIYGGGGVTARVLPVNTQNQKDRLMSLSAIKTAPTITSIVTDSLAVLVSDNANNLDIPALGPPLLKDTSQQLAVFDVPIFHSVTNAAVLTGLQPTLLAQVNLLQNAMANYYVGHGDLIRGWFLSANQNTFAAGFAGGNTPQMVDGLQMPNPFSTQVANQFTAMLAVAPTAMGAAAVAGGKWTRKAQDPSDANMLGAWVTLPY